MRYVVPGVNEKPRFIRGTNYSMRDPAEKMCRPCGEVASITPTERFQPNTSAYAGPGSLVTLLPPCSRW